MTKGKSWKIRIETPTGRKAFVDIDLRVLGGEFTGPNAIADRIARSVRANVIELIGRDA